MNHCLYNIIGAQEQKNVLVSVMSIVEDGMEAHTETIPTTTAVHVHTIMELGEVFLYTIGLQALKYNLVLRGLAPP